MIFKESDIVFLEMNIVFYENYMTLKRGNISKGETKIVIRESNRLKYTI
jgi:hypothetical protein